MRGGGPSTAVGRSLGWQSTEGRACARAPPRPGALLAVQPTRGLDVGAIEFVHRRLIAERDEGRGVLLGLVRARWSLCSPIASSSFRGPDRRRRPAGRLREHARPRHDRRRARGGGCMTEAAVPPTEALPPVAPLATEPKKRFNGQGLIVSLITTALAFPRRRARRARDRQRPIGTYRAIFHGTGITWLVPGYGDRADEASNLQQTLLVTTPLILCPGSRSRSRSGAGCSTSVARASISSARTSP